MKVTKELQFKIIVNEEEFEIIRTSLIRFISDATTDEKEVADKANYLLAEFSGILDA